MPRTSIACTVVGLLVLVASSASAQDGGGSRNYGSSGSSEDRAERLSNRTRVNIGLDLDVSGSISNTLADSAAKEVGVGPVILVGIEFSKFAAVVFRTGYLRSMTYSGDEQDSSAAGFMVPVLTGLRLQIPIGILRLHLEGNLGYAYCNKFARWAPNGGTASNHELLVDARFGLALFLGPYFSVDAGLFYRLPNALTKQIDSQDHRYAHSMGATVGVGVHF